MKNLSQLALILFLCGTFGFAQVVISGSAVLSGTLVCAPVSGSTATPVLAPFATPINTGDQALTAPSPVLAFGNQGESTASMAIPISISNCSNALYASKWGLCSGSGNLIVSSATITGTNASDFVLSGTSTGTIASGSDLEPTITFTPTQNSGTSESATLTVTYSGASVSTQTMSLTGTSATVTTLSSSSCPSTLTGGNYQLTSNISCGGSAFTVTNSGGAIDINLNGHSITYGTTASAAQVNAIDGVVDPSLTVHNGTLIAGSAANTFGYGHPQSSVIEFSGYSTPSSFFNLNFDYGTNTQYANAIEVDGANLIVHDVYFDNSAVGTCAEIACRAELYATPIYAENVSSLTSGLTQMYNISQNGGPQGGISLPQPGASLTYSILNPGNASGGNTNDFAVYAWGPNVNVNHLAILTPLTSGSNARGVQISAAQESVTGADVNNNIITSREDAYNSEAGGCEGGGAYGVQIDDNPTGPNTLNNNEVTAYANNCPGEGLRFTDTEYATNVSSNSTYDAIRESGAPTCITSTWAAEYPGCGYAFAIDGSEGGTSLNDVFTGDSADIFISADGAPAETQGITIQSPTFYKGSNPGTFWHFLVTQNGPSSADSEIANVNVIDPTFGPGVSFTDTSIFAQSSNTGPVSVWEKWTQTMQVNKASGPAVDGAVVTWTDTASNTYTCTTNSSGTCTVQLPQYRDNNDTAANQVEDYNPYTLSIPFTGCTTDTETGLTISATGTKTVSLGGC